jgi:hypothetical protein
MSFQIVLSPAAGSLKMCITKYLFETKAHPKCFRLRWAKINDAPPKRKLHRGLKIWKQKNNILFLFKIFTSLSIGFIYLIFFYFTFEEIENKNNDNLLTENNNNSSCFSELGLNSELISQLETYSSSIFCISSTTDINRKKNDLYIGLMFCFACNNVFLSLFTTGIVYFLVKEKTFV